MEIVAFNADTKADGTGTAGITWISKNCVDKHEMNDSSVKEGGWAASEMRAWLQSEYYNTLPDDVKNTIVDVIKTYNECPRYSYSYSSSRVTKTCVDNIWIPSVHELFGDSDHYCERTGVTYTEYFNTTDSTKKSLGGATSTQMWSRTATLYNDTCTFWGIHGGFYAQYYAGMVLPFALGFCT